jgi:hypothetical protein
MAVGRVYGGVAVQAWQVVFFMIPSRRPVAAVFISIAAAFNPARQAAA